MSTTVARSLAEALSALEQPITSLVLLKVPVDTQGEARALATALQKSVKLSILAVDAAYGQHSVELLLKIFQEVLPHSNIRELHIDSVAIDDRTAELVADALQGSSLEALGLCRCGLSSEAVRFVVRAIHEKLSITYLNISGNTFGDTGAAIVSAVISTNTTLLRLGLANCGIGPAGAKAITEALTRNRTLNNLDLGYNDMGDSTALATVVQTHPSLRTLKVDVNEKTLQGLQAFLCCDSGRPVCAAKCSNRWPSRPACQLPPTCST